MRKTPKRRRSIKTDLSASKRCSRGRKFKTTAYEQQIPHARSLAWQHNHTTPSRDQISPRNKTLALTRFQRSSLTSTQKLLMSSNLTEQLHARYTKPDFSPTNAITLQLSLIRTAITKTQRLLYFSRQNTHAKGKTDL
ncbi:hypothetical protein F511_15879 [Dorcoceras hygrometricum]|uniref:Uncharacterized protein n=1 Tax=Dorcoceras hygrometricum TaxID=472368 RepID=A0A2Z7BCA9_9LAMI|nr:hypothetical protein F511_15879 [Dorcoceras hygrometricum]